MQGDVLSDVLGTVRLSGAIFFDVAATTPWVAEAPSTSVLASRVIPDAQHVIEYHIITRGYGWAALIDNEIEPVRLGPGSIIMFPQGDPHVLSSEPAMRADPDLTVFDQSVGKSPPFYVEQFGGGPEETRIICGFLGCDILPFNPVIHALPRMIHLPDRYTGNGWLRHLIKGITAESENRRIATQSVLSRMSELLFIEVVRSYAESLPVESTGWLAALGDQHLGRAIGLLHGNPKRHWTLKSLAIDVGVSRTVLVDRFTTYLGMPPMTYLTNWRMQLAARLLADGSTTNAKVAEAVGYESEAAFSRAFKRHTGVTPGAWRTRGIRRKNT